MPIVGINTSPTKPIGFSTPAIVASPPAIQLLVDTATIATVTAITVGELEFVHPAGYWGSFDDDDGQL